MSTFMMGRRGLLAGAAALAAAPAALAQADPVLSTTAGKLRGKTENGIKVFKGVPYGDTTAGRRFMPPQPPKPWIGVRDALDFGHQSPQVGADRPIMYASWSNPRPEGEDCLVLNVYTPGVGDGKKRPVMVWFHGGGYTSGSASSHYADGVRLAKRGDVVVVTVNHRLNAFGFMYLAHLDPTLADSGNAGTMDMVQALRWVHDNAAAIGGDPNTVLIFGQSGGGGKVSTLMATPSAQGLFHRAVVQSGSGINAIDIKTAEASTARVMAALKLPVSAAGVARLKAMPQPELSKALQDAGGTFGPVLDMRTLVRHPFAPDAPPMSRSVPLLVGTAKDETAGLVGGRDETLFHLTWETLPERLKGQIGSMDAPSTIAKLRAIYPNAKPSDIFFTATTDQRFRRNAILQAERKAAQAKSGGAPVYMYLFEWETPVNGGKWKAPHSIEHAFVFDNVAKSASMVGSGPDQQKIADAMSSAWIRFARTGDASWPAYTPETRATMVFNVTPKVVNDPHAPERELFKA